MLLLCGWKTGWHDDAVSCPPPVAEPVQVVWPHFILYKHRARCDAHVFPAIGHTGVASTAAWVVLWSIWLRFCWEGSRVSPAVLVVNGNTEWTKSMEAKPPWCPKTTNWLRVLKEGMEGALPPYGPMPSHVPCIPSWLLGRAYSRQFLKFQPGPVAELG